MFPLGDLPNPAFVMGVQGPLARSATDLELLFDLIVGPDAGEDAAWRLDLPRARHDHLRDFRVAVMPAFPWVAPSQAMAARVDALAAFLRGEGATVAEAMPSFDQQRHFDDYLRLLFALTSPPKAREEKDEEAAQLARSDDFFLQRQADALRLDAQGYLSLLTRREQAKLAWRQFFQDWDVLIGPTALDVAFPHEDRPWNERTLTIDGREVSYQTNLVYPMWAIFTGHPATAFPAGLSPEGLPVGLQAVGPYLGDRTTLRFAQLLEKAWERFTVPPGY